MSSYSTILILVWSHIDYMFISFIMYLNLYYVIISFNVQIMNVKRF